MENKHQQILSEINVLMATIKTQVEELEKKIAEYQQIVENQEVVSDLPVVEQVVEQVVEPVVETFDELVEAEPVDEILDDVMDIELEPSDDLPFYDDLPVSEPEVEIEIPVEPEIEDLPEDILEPVVELEPVTEPLPVIDAMIAKQPWRTDMPGSPVKDIRSAISLNDRILFINYLFGEDPMAFQEMLTQLNAMASFDEAASHAIAAHPEWNLESDTVYRFMMALRRRHQ
jgi:hypothetical protein